MRIVFAVLACMLCFNALAQTNTSFYINGDNDKFYPVIFSDAAWGENRATSIELGRSDVHKDGEWRGSLMARFRYHVTNYGHGSKFIEADIHASSSFIAGWVDVTSRNGDSQIIIWLRGGGNTYYINSQFSISFQIYDGIQNSLPFQESNGPAHSFKTSIDAYVNQYGKTEYGNVYYLGGGNSFFEGNVGIGTKTPAEKLSVNGNIRAKEIKVETANWPDYVFEPTYKLASLSELEAYIKTHKHLPEIPSAREAEENGIGLGEMNARLLKKIEELTLHLIDKEKQIEEVQNKLEKQDLEFLKQKEELAKINKLIGQLILKNN